MTEGRSPRSRPRRRDDIELVHLGDEQVIWDERRDTVFRLDPVSALLWQFFDGSASIEDLIADAMAAWDMSAGKANDGIAALVEQLDGAGLFVDSPMQVVSNEQSAYLSNKPVPCGEQALGTMWSEPFAIEVEGTKIVLRAESDDDCLLLQKALDEWRIDDACEVVNYSVRLTPSQRDLHLLFWGGCLVARERTAEGLIGVLASHLGGHRAPADGVVRLQTALIHDGRTAIGLPFVSRSLAWKVAPRLRRTGVAVAAPPYVDLDPESAFLAPPTRLALGGPHIDELLARYGEHVSERSSAGPRLQLTALVAYSPTLEHTAAEAVLELVRQHYVRPRQTAGHLAATLLDHVELLSTMDISPPVMTRLVGSALGVTAAAS